MMEHLDRAAVDEGWAEARELQRIADASQAKADRAWGILTHTWAFVAGGLVASFYYWLVSVR